MRMLRAETTVAERSAAGLSPVMSDQPIKRTFSPPHTLVRARDCSASKMLWPLYRGIRTRRAETVVAERPAAGRSPAMQRGSQLSASLSSTYDRPR